MKIGIDVDGVIIDYERVVKTYAELYDLLELKKDGAINKDEPYFQKRYDWTQEQIDDFIKKYLMPLTFESRILPGVKDVINLLKTTGMS